MSIVLEHVNYTYSKDTVYTVQALKDINLTIEEGEFIGIIGHTGSGKSTFIQHLNGLLRADSGHIYVDGEDIYAEGYNMRALRNYVGVVFQYPDHQLFESTNFEDVCFGLDKMKLEKMEVIERARQALDDVGLPRKMFAHSPFEISGGQKRRVAIAGVLAMRPKVLVLDEPTAGLDPAGRDEILDLIAKLHKEKGITIILVSHSMDDVAKYVNRIIVMNQGEIMYDDKPREVFRHYRELEAVGLAAPQITYLMNDLKDLGLPVNTEAATVEEAAESIAEALKKG